MKFSTDMFLEDYNDIIDSIEEIHPDPYANFNKKDLDKESIQIKKKLKNCTTLNDFIRTALPIITKLKDGHTSIQYPYQEWIKQNPFSFPFAVDIDYKTLKLIIIRDYSDEEGLIPKNAEIISINDVSTKDIIQKMMEYKSGEAKSFIIELVKESFTIGLWIIFNFDKDFKVKYKIDNKESSTLIKGVKLDIFHDRIKRIRDNNSNIPYSFRYHEDKIIGIIEFNQFSDLNEFKAFLESTFTQLKLNKTKNLVIDIRNNGGVNSSLGDELFQYISKTPFEQFGKTIVKYSNKRKNFYKSYLKQVATNLSEEELENYIDEHPVGSIITNEESSELQQLRENNLRYNGNIFLLISPETYSSASVFAWVFKFFNMGTIIGEETGGHIVSFGDVIFTNLPNTKLQLGVSHKKFFGYGAFDNQTHGVIPDIEIQANDALNYCINLMRKENFNEIGTNIEST